MKTPANSCFLVAITVLSFAASCSQIPPGAVYPQLPPDEQRAGEGYERAALLQELRHDDERVATVAFRIAITNGELCTDKAPLTGLVLSSLLQYRPGLRTAAAEALGLSSEPTIEAIVPGSPASISGLRVGDVILAINGTLLNPAHGASDAPVTYQGVERALAQLGAALDRGGVTLTVRRSRAEALVELRSVSGCAYDAQVLPSKEMNASADGRHVFIATGLVRYAVTDDDLAVVLAHEYAHNILHHHTQLDRHGFARKILGPVGSTPGSLRTAEKEADYVGLYLLARAGYAITAAPRFWRRFAADYGDAWYVRWSHPGSLERAASLEAARREIQEKITAGQPLAPRMPP